MLRPRSEQLEHQDEHSIFIQAAQEAPDETFHEMTGKKGDVILMHPLMLHSASRNGRRSISTYQVDPFSGSELDSSFLAIDADQDLPIGVITNPLVALSAPFEFQRANPADYSLVELKTIADLGGPAKFIDGWKITGERQMFVPERVWRQRQMQEAENDRLRKLDLPLADNSLVQLPEFLTAQKAAKAGA